LGVASWLPLGVDKSESYILSFQYFSEETRTEPQLAKLAPENPDARSRIFTKLVTSEEHG
jgi:hypothetical protein